GYQLFFATNVDGDCLVGNQALHAHADEGESLLQVEHVAEVLGELVQHAGFLGGGGDGGQRIAAGDVGCRDDILGRFGEAGGGSEATLDFDVHREPDLLLIAARADSQALQFDVAAAQDVDDDRVEALAGFRDNDVHRLIQRQCAAVLAIG